MQKGAIGIIGGSGLYRMFTNRELVNINTSYGEPSSPIQVGTVADKKVYFIPRHGINHEIPPHKVNYRANIQAMYDLGVRQIFATHALGSLNPSMKPGDFVISDQFVNKTWGREDTYFNGPDTVHISTSDPFCNCLRNNISKVFDRFGFKYHKKATMLVIQGPRFSTRAENLIFSQERNDVISMTGYPEAVLARERGICYVSVGIVTDIACVLGSKVHPQHPSSHAEVVNTFEVSVENILSVLDYAVTNIDKQKIHCECIQSLKGAKC
ncbi:MTAP family purine nucleoside phosphorylase [Cytobacillus praedii]|jgi:5'-methylthioadenosine phosphorylase|uniref:MTAP family purine nucleoside phosphorylase n=1 Tax=Cytobacillus praedii TaxID=1742358 RepID=UPI002E1AB571|nr:MTAP family purine nucleoside phosphorylase [Cytobacillus praedii]